jgi:sensor c-di-GMP phosphodiesterase-like protein
MPSFHVPRWLRTHTTLLLWAMFASVTSPMLMLVFSYYQTLHRAEASLQAAVEQATRRIDSLLTTTDLILMDLAADIQNLDALNTETALNLAQTITYADPRFREVGIVDEDGALVVTSLGILDPPIPLPDDIRADLDRKTLQIVGPVTTKVMQERSIVLALPTQGKGEVNVLIDPIILTTYWSDIEQLDLGRTGFLAYVNAQSGRVLAGDGAVPPHFDLETPSPEPGVMQIRQVAHQGDVVIVAEVSKAWVLSDWRASLWMNGLLAAIGSGALMAVFLGLIHTSYNLDYDLKHALMQGEFEVYYQPIFDLHTHCCVGAEALLRWHHPHQGLLLPGVFIATAEATGLICDLGFWVFQQVLRDQALLHNQHPDLYISINLSPIQLNGAGCEPILLALMQSEPVIAVHKLMFEVTEAILLDDTRTAALEVISRLRNLGAVIALDDFGTGYSNLGYLHKFQLDYIKVDRMFVGAIQQSPRINTVVEAVIDLGRNLNIDLIAEGVETEAQLDFLKQRSVRYFQGNLLAHPMPLEAFQAFLAENHATYARPQAK